ncbi:MAG: HAMP domain-containing histidine kinase [Hyphomicrobiaceae bacterium]|nr:MAG: HAMP domain-containing histidine kinase [Hyphomicrobiaceae bacterium]
MRSLRLRLLLGAVLGVSAALAIAGVVLVAIFGAHVHRRYVKELDDHLLQLAAVIQIDEAGAISLRHELSDPAFQRPLSGLYWQVIDAGRVALRSRSLWDDSLALRPATSAPGVLLESESAGPSGQKVVLIERTVLLQDRPLRLAVAGDSKIVDEARGEFALVVALSLAVLGVLLAAASWLQVGAGLAPLNTLRSQLGRLRQGRTQRLEGPYPTELSGLIEDLNGLLATQASELERARANAGKLGHGLKTPLAMLGAEARTIREKGNAASADAIEREIESMNAQVVRILAAVRAVGPRKAVGASSPLKPLLERLISVMKRLPRGAELEWTLTVRDGNVEAPVDARDLEDLFGNLLDNARKWAKSRVRIAIAGTADTILVSVDDDGPGIPPEQLDDVLLHGTRLDRAVPGTGIGLTIAKDLAQLHGGSLVLLAGAAGGVRVDVLLPAATAWQYQSGWAP